MKSHTNGGHVQHYDWPVKEVRCMNKHVILGFIAGFKF